MQKNKLISIITIFCFVSIVLIPLGIALMWFLLDWKKIKKIIISVISTVLYAGIIVFILMLEPAYNTSGSSLPFSSSKGASAVESEFSSGKKTKKQEFSFEEPKKSKKSDLEIDEIENEKLPKSIKKQAGGESRRVIFTMLFFLFLLVLIIWQNLHNAKKRSKYENPYVNTDLYKLPLADDAKIPMVHYLRLRLSAGEQILFASETVQSGCEGDFVITNERVVIKNLKENVEYKLAQVEAVSSDSNSVMLLTCGDKKHYIFLNETQMPYALAVVRWAYKKFVTTNS